MVDAYVGVALDGRVDMLVFMLMFDVVVASANVFDDGNFCSSCVAHVCVQALLPEALVQDLVVARVKVARVNVTTQRRLVGFGKPSPPPALVEVGQYEAPQRGSRIFCSRIFGSRIFGIAP